MARCKLCTTKTLEISNFQTVHCPSKNPISPKVFNQISKTFLQLKDVEGGHLGGYFQVRRYFTFDMARWKLCAWTPFEISHFQPVHCLSKNPISPKLINQFSKLLLQLEVVEGGHMGGKFQLRRYFTFAITRWKVCTSTTFEISHFQPVHCPSKNPISPKVFNRFSKTFLQLKDVEGGHLGGNFQVPRYFAFEMARWKLCASTTFEISHFQPVHCPRYSTDFRKLCFSSKMLKVGLGGKLEVRRYFTFAMARWKLCASTPFEISHFQTCTLSQQKSYIPKGIQPIFENFASARRCWRWAFRWKSSVAQVFCLCRWQGENFAHRQHLKFPTFNMYTVPAKILYPKGIQPIFENFSSARRCWKWAFAWKVSGAQLFYFCNGKVKTLRIDTIWNFPLSTTVHCPSKNPISPKVFNRIFENFASALSMLKVGIWVEISVAQVFYFCTWQGENFAHRQHLKFPTFNLYTVPAKILYLQRYSTDFRKLCFSSKMLKVGIWVESCRCAGILPLQLQGENFAHRQHLKFPTFNLHTVPAKILYLQRYSTEFRKLCFSSKMLKVGIMGEKLQVRRYYTFAMTRRKLCASTTFEISHFQPVHCPSKNPISPKVFNGFSKTLLQLEDVEGGHMGGKFQVRRYFTFAMHRWKLCTSTKFEISHFQPVHCPSKNPISPKVFNRISKTLLQLEDVEVGISVEIFSCPGILPLQMASLKTLRIDNIWNFPLSTCTVPAKIPYPKGIQPIFGNFSSCSKMLKVGICVESWRCEVFYFCNGKVKTFRIDNIWNFPLSTCTRYQQKSYISKGIQPIFENFASVRSCWRCAYEWKVAGAQVFYFGNYKVKTLRIDNIWNFPLSTCTQSQQKSYISKGIQPNFQKLCFTLKMLKVGIWVESFRCAGILPLQWQGENFAHRQHLKFPTFNLYTVPAKILYLQRYSTDFRKLSFSSKMLKAWHLGGNFQVPRYFAFEMARWKPCASTTFEISHFQPVHCPIKNPISQRYSTDFQKLFFCSKMLKVGLGGKLEVRRYFTFAMARWKLCASTTFEISHFQPVHCPSKNPISPKVFNRISKALLQLEVVEGGHLGGNLQLPQVFCLWDGKVKTLRIDNIWNFPLSTCTLSQRYSTDFRKRFFSSKMLKVGICVESWRCAGILLLQ